ncbi:MAG: SAM-dependent methyltransferase, partial [Lapillicoccus sp.]
GDAGFYRQPAGPAGHFTTATHGAPGRVLARALVAWADRLGCDSIVDLGAGRGELLAHLREVAPDRPLAGVDVVARPDHLADDIGWLVSPGGGLLPDDLRPTDALVVAHEWLDVVPCPVLERDDQGVARQVLVDPSTGAESLGEAASGADLEWCQRFWPSIIDQAAAPRDRAEVGLPRDVAWSALLDRMTRGAAIAVDYGHLVEGRPADGSLVAYRQGQRVTPVPDGSCDLTADVAVDALRHTELVRQSVALRRVGVRAGTPDHALSRSDPPAYLQGLADAGAAASLLAPGGFGDFWWVIARLP